jgi:5'-nucleotidase (lipoprotein e(P4) family)
LCLQSYNLAKLRVDEALKDVKAYTDKPFAIVTDLDETALDNSRNEAWLYLQNSAYSPKEFEDWSTFGKAGAVPGSVDFFKYVDALRDRRGRKIAIYYVSNRRDTVTIVDSTMSQMRLLHFPQLTDSQFLFQPTGSPSSKEPRRNKIAASHSIILLLGDNLIDLTAAFDNTAIDPQRRLRMVDSLHADWGKKYIIFPNAEYGDWEAALYPGGKYPHTLGEEWKYRRQALDSVHFIKQ